MLSPLVSVLVSFFANPEVHVVYSPSEEIAELRAQIASLEAEIERLDAVAKRAEALYGQECVINLRLEDQLRYYGIRPLH